MSGLTIIKLGSSVLTGDHALHRAAVAVRDSAQRGPTLVVISALAGETDRLFASATAWVGLPGAEEVIAALVATGESVAAARFAGALAALGESAAVLDPRRTLVVGGPRLDGDPVDVDGVEIERAFERCRVAVLPGFVGESVESGTALLGRGGSDLTALFLGSRLGAAECRLVKDVDGIFERDPAAPGEPPARFRTLDWSTAARVAGRLVQPKALAFATAQRIAFSVCALESDGGSRVGALPTRFATRQQEVCA